MDNTNLILLVAGYLYSLTDDYEGMDQTWYLSFFMGIYIKYKDTEHSGDCTQQPWSCWVCFIDKYMDLASTIINKDTFNLYLEELKE